MTKGYFFGFPMFLKGERSCIAGSEKLGNTKNLLEISRGHF